MRLRRYLVPGTALLIVGATAGPAAAAVTVSGSNVTGDDTNETVVVYCQDGALAAVGGAGTGGPCHSLTRIGVNPGSGADSVNVSGVTAASFAAESYVDTNLSDGMADRYEGSPLNDRVDADEHDVVATGEGDDFLRNAGAAHAGAGDDLIVSLRAYGSAYGGSGDDRFIGMVPSPETATLRDGGSGFDIWEFDMPAFGIPGASYFSDGAQITVTDTSATFMDSGLAPESVSGALSSVEFVAFSLGGGGQTWSGAGFSGGQRIRGEAGADALTGGAGDDQLHGGSDDDTLTGNGGADRLSGAAGNDTINARDGVADVVDCGDGADKVVADAADRVIDCESVDLPPVAQPAPPTVAPDTSAVAGPKRLSASAKGKQAKKQAFTFSSPTAGATFECAVDDGAFAACSSPYKLKAKALKKLKAGKHTLQVRAVAGGLTDGSPSVAVFKVKR